MNLAVDRARPQGRIKLLADRSFLLYLIACFLVTFGSGLSYITTNWLVFSVRHNPLDGIIMMLCFWLPSAILAPYWGVWVDRCSCKWLLCGSHCCRGLLLLGFGWFLYAHARSTYSLDLLTLLMGSMFSMILPTTVTFVRELVAEADLLHANTMIDMVYEMGSVVGMGCAGFLLAFFSPSATFMINSLTFFLSALVLCTVHPSYPRKKSELIRKSIGSELMQGLRYISRNKNLKIIYILQLTIFASVMITPVLIVPFARTILHVDAIGFSIIEMGLSVGLVTGCFMMPHMVEYIGLRRGLFWLTGGLTLFYFLFSLNHYFWFSVLLYFLIGVALSCWALVVTQSQKVTEKSYQGRVQSVFSSMSSLVVLGLYLLIAYGTSVLSVHWLYIFPAALALCSVFLVSRIRHAT